MLAQNHPNPFNPSTTILFDLPVESYVMLKVFNILGKEVATLIDGRQEAGYKTIEFSAEGVSASGGNASTLASGIYFFRLDATSVHDPGKSFTQVKKMLLMK